MQIVSINVFLAAYAALPYVLGALLIAFVLTTIVGRKNIRDLIRKG